MSVDESIDEISPTGSFFGSKSRRDIHANGLWHDVFHCLVIRTSDPTTVVLQRRCSKAKSFPNKLDLSATGHLLSGEKPRDGVRELHEELGIDIDPGQLALVGTRLLADDSGEGQNRERINLFFASDDRPLEDFAPDPTEVESIVEVETDALLQILNDPEQKISATEWHPSTGISNPTLRHSDLVTPVDGYWNVTMVMADRFARGLHPIAI